MKILTSAMYVKQTENLQILCKSGVKNTFRSDLCKHLLKYSAIRKAGSNKISSNSALAAKKTAWIDFDAGKIAEEKTVSELSPVLFGEVLEIASGKRTKSEISGYHDVAISKKGVTL